MKKNETDNGRGSKLDIVDVEMAIRLVGKSTLIQLEPEKAEVYAYALTFWAASKPIAWIEINGVGNDDSCHIFLSSDLLCHNYHAYCANLKQAQESLLAYLHALRAEALHEEESTPTELTQDEKDILVDALSFGIHNNIGHPRHRITPLIIKIAQWPVVEKERAGEDHE